MTPPSGTGATTAAGNAHDHTAVDALAERHLDALLELDPLTATFIGVPGYDHLMPDLSPAGLHALAELNRSTLRELSEATPVDDTPTR